MNKKKAGKLLQRFCIGKSPEKCKRCQVKTCAQKAREPLEDEELEPVNCAAAVRAIKDAGIFMLLDRDEYHYLVTEEFIL